MPGHGVGGERQGRARQRHPRHQWTADVGGARAQQETANRLRRQTGECTQLSVLTQLHPRTTIVIESRVHPPHAQGCARNRCLCLTPINDV